MERIAIDYKWSVEYDPEDNNRPVGVYRYGDYSGPFKGDNLSYTMFWRILEDNRSRE